MLRITNKETFNFLKSNLSSDDWRPKLTYFQVMKIKEKNYLLATNGYAACMVTEENPFAFELEDAKEGFYAVNETVMEFVFKSEFETDEKGELDKKPFEDIFTKHNHEVFERIGEGIQIDVPRTVKSMKYYLTWNLDLDSKIAYFMGMNPSSSVLTNPKVVTNLGAFLSLDARYLGRIYKRLANSTMKIAYGENQKTKYVNKPVIFENKRYDHDKREKVTTEIVAIMPLAFPR